MSDLSDEIHKIKYQLRLVGESINHREHPIPALVISMDWSEEDLEAANDIFELYDNKLRSNEEVNWTEFEFAIRNRFSIGYQTVKLIILAFYRNYQWTDVCREYAFAHETVEFHEITRGDDA